MFKGPGYWKLKPPWVSCNSLAIPDNSSLESFLLYAPVLADLFSSSKRLSLNKSFAKSISVSSFLDGSAPPVCFLFGLVLECGKPWHDAKKLLFLVNEFKYIPQNTMNYKHPNLYNSTK